MKRTCWLTLFLALPAAAALDLFVAGGDGYHTFRIPALVVTAKGTVLAFAEARKDSPKDHGNIDLVMRRSTDHGRTWGPMSIVHEEGGDAPITIGNPAPVAARDGTVHLLLTRNNQRLLYTRSTDDGQGFASPADITDALRGFDFPWTRVGAGPGHGIQLKSGRLLVPIWLNEKIHHNYRSGVVFSDDGGKTWKAGGLAPPEAKDSNECMLFERRDGTVVMNMRTRAKQRATAVSRDGGLTFGEFREEAALPDPVCQASVLRTAHGVLFANPASADKRVNLTVRLSRDEGATWAASKVLHGGPSAYSDLAEAKDGNILCLYESGERGPYERLRLARFSIEWLLSP
jgi:sialidase-1